MRQGGSAVESRVQVACLVILTTIAVAAALYWLQPVLIPFVLALFIALGLSPLVDLQIRVLRLPRPVALLATLLLVALLFALVGLVFSASVTRLADSAGTYEAQLNLMVSQLYERLPEEWVAQLPEGQVASFASIPASTVGQILGQITNAILGVLSQSFVVFIFVMFLLIGGGQWSRQEEGTLGEIVSRIRRYLVVNAGISGATGALVAITLLVLQVPLAIVFGLLAFLLNFIPNIGSIVATLLPLPVVIITPEISPGVAVLAIAIPGAIQVVIGNMIAPKVMGDSLDLHPVVILLALIFWGMLWGVVGMLLATPITAVVKILLEKLPSGRPLAELMAGRIASVAEDSAEA